MNPLMYLQPLVTNPAHIIAVAAGLGAVRQFPQDIRQCRLWSEFLDYASHYKGYFLESGELWVPDGLKGCSMSKLARTH
jgi:hypothetical protein